MNRRTFLKGSSAAAVAIIIGPPELAQAAPIDLEQAFRNPPNSAKPHTWWHWMNGNISEVGITRDLEAMSRVGVGGFQLFQVGSGIAKGPVDFWSEEHFRLMRHAISEAGRLGLECTIHNCPGWSSSGGPWFLDRIDLSMQILTWSEVTVEGGRTVNISLPQPPTNVVNTRTGPRTYYRDAMVLAFPATPTDRAQPVRVRTHAGAAELSQLDSEQGIELRPAAEGGQVWLEVEFAEPLEVRSVSAIVQPLGAAPGRGAAPGPGRGMPAAVVTVEVSEDGKQYRPIGTLAPSAGRGRGSALALPASISLPVTKVRAIRLSGNQAVRVRSVRLSGIGSIADWAVKANFTGRGLGFGPVAPGAPSTPAVPLNGGVIDPKRVLNITANMDAQGRLNWQAPPGVWTIMRIGHTTTGVGPHPVPDGAEGLECDKFNPEAFDYHFQQFFGRLLDALAPLAKRGMAGVLIDSYETGLQNWTARFPEEFRKRRGYDLTPYMPAMFGRVVASPEISEKFLWDVRKTQAELMNENYYGRLAELCRKYGFISYTEPYDPGNFDEMVAGSKVDRVMGEFWLGQTNHHSIKLVASVAHINGMDYVGAESFTGQTRWQEHPYCMKTTGDFMFTQGLNHYVFHRYCHQPHPDVAPGMTMGPWGWHFDRTNTWFDKSTGWLTYVRRAQSMLKQGVFVGDLLYLTSEDSPVVAPGLTQPANRLEPLPPPGYDWDTVDPPSLINKSKVVDGRIQFPSGSSYRVLILRPSNKITLPLVRRLRDLVREGAVLVVNSRPDGSPSMAESDAEVRAIVKELWGNLDGKTVTERTFGAGRVFWGVPLAEVLAKLNLPPDFEVTAASADAPVNFIHRRAGDADFYFIATRRRLAEQLVCTFRVSGKQPELWDAVTGEITPLAAYEEVGGRTRVPIRLGPAGSVFVVFRRPASPRRLVSVVRDGMELLSTKPFPARQRGLYRDVTNNFTISVWIKPELMGNPPTVGGQAPGPGGPGGGGGMGGGVTFLFHPPEGAVVYGAGHAACGLAASRNGVAVYERTKGNAVPVASAQVPIAGWTHVALVYRNGEPELYVDGRQVGKALKSGNIVHPGLGESYQDENSAYFMGEMTEPVLIREALSPARIAELVKAGLPRPADPPAFEPAAGQTPSFRFWQGGNYALRYSDGQSSSLVIPTLAQPVEIRGPWRVQFPPNLGAPSEITLQELISLHRHPDEGVKYFSGTATYLTQFNLPGDALAGGRRAFLDLGRVEVIAEVQLNGKPLGNLWMPPYRLDVTEALRSGQNDLRVEVATLWPNRLIGDEQLPPEYEYNVGAAGTGGIRAIPEWYAKGQPRPPSKRVAFTTWKWYSKDDPLLESGLLGPVTIRFALIRQV